jgi:hypothetical protein
MASAAGFIQSVVGFIFVVIANKIVAKFDKTVHCFRRRTDEITRSEKMDFCLQLYINNWFADGTFAIFIVNNCFFTDETVAMEQGFSYWPEKFSLEAYEYIGREILYNFKSIYDDYHCYCYRNGSQCGYYFHACVYVISKRSSGEKTS